MIINLFLITIFFVLGSCIGSFLSVVISRIHDGEKGIVTGRSFCPKCKKQLEWRDLIPLVSFFVNRKQCRKCGQEISWFYPALELTTGILFALAIYFFYFDAALFYCAVFTVLVACSFFDLRYQMLPDAFSFILIALAVLGSWLGYTTHWVWAFWGMVIFGGFFGLQILVSKGKWLGSGDLILGIGLGLLLGLANTLVCLIFAYLVGSAVGVVVIYGKEKIDLEKTYLPFAPFLAGGAVFAILWGREIASWYMAGWN